MELLQELEKKDFTNDDNLLNQRETVYDKELATNHVIQDISKSLEESISKEVDKINLKDSIWQKVSQTQLKDVIQNAIETTLKLILKKKFNVNYSTFNEMKKAVSSAMDGNLKESLKNVSDVAVDGIKVLDGKTKSAIKSIKNKVIDVTVDSQRYEVTNRQTKIINRIGKNCEEFQKYLSLNDATNIKKKALAIQKDMKQILPIRETINMAQMTLDRYELWKNKGEKALTEEENELINQFYRSA